MNKQLSPLEQAKQAGREEVIAEVAEHSKERNNWGIDSSIAKLVEHLKSKFLTKSDE